jgi:hypothetical protein
MNKPISHRKDCECELCGETKPLSSIMACEECRDKIMAAIHVESELERTKRERDLARAVIKDILSRYPNLEERTMEPVLWAEWLKAAGE